jgi:hypothetical protein
VHENPDLWPRHSASHSRSRTGNFTNPVSPSKTAIRSVTHPEPQAAETPLSTNVAAELSSFQSPIELPTNALETESIPFQPQRQENPGDIQRLNNPVKNPVSSPPLALAMRPVRDSSKSSGPSTTRRQRHDPSSVEPPVQPSLRLGLGIDEDHRRQGLIATPRHAFSGSSNSDRGTTELEKEKKRDGPERLTPKQQLHHPEKRERDKVERVRIRMEIILGEIRRKLEEERKKKQDAIELEEYKQQRIIEALREKEKRDKEFMNDRLKALGYTNEEIDAIINKVEKEEG